MLPSPSQGGPCSSSFLFLLLFLFFVGSFLSFSFLFSFVWQPLIVLVVLHLFFLLLLGPFAFFGAPCPSILWWNSSVVFWCGKAPSPLGFRSLKDPGTRVEKIFQLVADPWESVWVSVLPCPVLGSVSLALQELPGAKLARVALTDVGVLVCWAVSPPAKPPSPSPSSSCALPLLAASFSGLPGGLRKTVPGPWWGMPLVQE